MRKIESQMCQAIQNNESWQSGNTCVTTQQDGVSTVYLHGNKIAEIDDTTMTIFDGGWQTNTTKSRLNALCSEFCNAGEGVFQKNYDWFISKFDTTTNQLTNILFTNGFVFS